MFRSALISTKRLPINFIKRIFFLVKVEGESLWPELVPGKRYLATSVLKPRAGDYLIFKNPKNLQEIFVKKIKNILDDSYEVSGTVPWSNSSREFGLVPDELVLGKIILPHLFTLRVPQKQKLPTSGSFCNPA